MAAPSRSISTSTRTPSRAHLEPACRPFEPHGAAREILYARDPEVIVSGPAGTGKSRVILEKLHLVATKYPGCRILLCRKTRAALTESVLVTFEQEVLPPNHPALQSGGQRLNRHSYVYPNGSELICGGLDKPNKVMSTQYDVIYCNELIEFTEHDWESLSSRNRNFVVPYQQLIADTNPDHPRHWVKLRGDAGKCRWIESRHEDNPVYWDPRTQQPTPRGAVYFRKLDNLSGARKLRLRHGRWAAAEGVVYPEFDAAVHRIDRFAIPADWARFRVIDFGYTNPFVCAWYAVDPDGRLYRYREIYHTRRTVRTHAATIRTVEDAGEAIEACVADHDAEDRATLEEEGIGTEAAQKAVSVGIEAVRERLKPAGDGRPRLFFLRDSLVERDPELAEAKKPTCTEEEFDSYLWAKTTEARGPREEPVKLNDHGLDALRYACVYADGRGTHWIEVF